MNESAANQKTRIKLHGRYSIGLRNQNEEHLLNLWESNILEAQFMFPLAIVDYLELYFLFKEQIT